MPVVIGGDNLPSPVGIGLTDLPNIGGGPVAPPVPASLRHISQYGHGFLSIFFGGKYDLIQLHYTTILP